MSGTDLSIEAQVVIAHVAEWANLVGLAVAMRGGRVVDISAVAKACKKNQDSITAKLIAIGAAIESGMTPGQVVDAGERETLKAKAKKRAEAADGMVNMTFRVLPDMKECVLEALDKIKNVMGYATREHCWMFIHSLVMDLTDEEIRQLAGMGK